MFFLSCSYPFQLCILLNPISDSIFCWNLEKWISDCDLWKLFHNVEVMNIKIYWTKHFVTSITNSLYYVYFHFKRKRNKRAKTMRFSMFYQLIFNWQRFFLIIDKYRWLEPTSINNSEWGLCLVGSYA